VFQYLPLFTIVNGVVLVVHGGLFHSADVTLSDLDLIKRHTFTLHDLPEGGETLESVPRDQPDAYYQQLQRDALWSDPHDIAGISPSARLVYSLLTHSLYVMLLLS
jgi:diadenosine tetraphosphatase ApaH/serine/threonine PP2A family protein phosphatase